MIDSDSGEAKAVVDTKVFNVAVVRTVAYMLSPYADVAFSVLDSGFLEADLKLHPDVAISKGELLRRFRQGLTRAAIEQRAHRDHADVRTLLATAALSGEVRADALLERLRDAIPAEGQELDKSAAMGSELVGKRDIGIDGVQLIVRSTVTLENLLRSLSRVPVSCEGTIQGLDDDGNYVVILTSTVDEELQNGVAAFTALLGKTSLAFVPALYPLRTCSDDAASANCSFV